MSHLDDAFGYRFAKAPKKLLYLSSVIVEFDPPLEQLMSQLKAIEKLLNVAMERPEPFKIKRLAYGFGDVTQTLSINSLDEMKNADFVIERRVSEPYERNRYFCSAPMKTNDFINLLESIEHELS
jgi:hypothetical protein